MQETAAVALELPESTKFVAESFDGQVSLKSDHSLHYCKCFYQQCISSA
jgi:hypothetical protein